MMKKVELIIWGIIVVMISYSTCYAIDPSVYVGTWKTKGRHVKIVMTITITNDITLEINGKTVDNLEYNYTYCESLTIYPFLCVYSEEDDVEHYIYLVIGANGKIDGDDLNILRGFYEFSKIIDQHYGETESVFYPIELIKVQEMEEES